MTAVAKLRTGRALLLALALLAAVAPAASAGGPLRLGFSSDTLLVGGTSSSRAPWIARAVSDGASIVRVNVDWAQIAPQRRPAHFNAADPNSPGYSWSAVDSVVKDLTSHGLAPLLTLYDAPTWAQAPGRPKTIRDGAWRPIARQFAQFATAAARRYNGSFPDPSGPGSLPRIRYWQAWNEPNINFYLGPQWVRSHNHWKPVAPNVYRDLLNAFYHAVRGVSASNFVVMAGTAPYGEPPGSEPPGFQRTSPVLFYREVFCLRRQTLKPYHCAHVYLNGVDHHPFAVKGPTWHALRADDASIPDVYKIARVVEAAVRDGRALPRAHKSIWVTELAWSSNPPNPHGVPVQTDARWYEQAMYVLWRQGVNTVMSLEIADPGHIANFSNVFESGLYYHSGKAKPIAAAYRFPFVIQRQGHGKIDAWGRAPQAGRLTIQRRAGGHWKSIRTLSVRHWQVFSVSLAFRGNATWRGVLASHPSLTWTQGAYTRK
jgi:hypothetical protein